MSETPKTEPKWQPSEKFYTAFRKASEGHKRQVRKGCDISYIGHLLGVASALIEAGGSEDQAIAAFLHDIVEDIGVTVAEIEVEFGETVAKIVAACTDATKEQKKAEDEKRKSMSDAEYAKHWWENRKQPYIDKLKAKTMDDPSVLVALADKTYNAENTVADLRGDRHRRPAGPELWVRPRSDAALGSGPVRPAPPDGHRGASAVPAGSPVD